MNTPKRISIRSNLAEQNLEPDTPICGAARVHWYYGVPVKIGVIRQDTLYTRYSLTEPAPQELEAITAESTSKESRPSKLIQSFTNHPIVAITGFVGSIASVIGLLLIFLPLQSEPELTIDAIVSSMSSINIEQRQRYFDKSLKGRYLPFAGKFEGAISGAIAAENLHIQTRMTYIFRTNEGVRVYALFDEASPELLPVFNNIEQSSTSVAGILDEITFHDGMILHLRKASLTDYIVVPRYNGGG